MHNKKKLSSKTELPLTLWLEKTADALFSKQILRVIAGKRWVISACWGEQPVIAKVFTRWSHAQRELRGVQALQKINLLTPKLLHHGWATEYACYILIFEKIDPAIDVNQAWWEGDVNQRHNILHQLIKTTGQLHQAGLQQRDPHLQNFLLNQEKIYVIDAGNISQSARNVAIPERLGLKNLALLFAQISPEYDQECEQWYRLYIQERGLIFTLSSLHLFQQWIKRWRQQHFTKYGKKVFRTTSNLLRVQSYKQLWVCERNYLTDAMQGFLNDPEKVLKQSTVKILKNGNTCTVIQLEIDGKLLVVKRYNIKNFWHGVNRAFRQSRAAIYWRNAMCLASWRLPVAKPIAFIEKRIGPIRRQAYYLMEYVHGSSLQSNESVDLVNKVKNLFTNLHNMWLTHGDLKANNILLTEDKKPVLLDLDSMRLHHFAKCKDRSLQRDKSRFLKNWDDSSSFKSIFSE